MSFILSVVAAALLLAFVAFMMWALFVQTNIFLQWAAASLLLGIILWMLQLDETRRAVSDFANAKTVEVAP